MGSLREPGQRRQASSRTDLSRLGVLVSGLIEAGIIDPPLALERRYLDRRLKAQIEPDGSVTCNGRVFGTLSSAATYARSTCQGSPDPEAANLPTNGWTFWQVRNADGKLESIRGLRSRFLRDETRKR